MINERSRVIACLAYFCFLVSCSSVEGRSFIDSSYAEAAKEYGLSYGLNTIAGLGVAKFCVPVENSHGKLSDVVFTYKSEFQTASRPVRIGAKYKEYLISFDVKKQFPEIILSMIYTNRFSKTTEINIMLSGFGGPNWDVNDNDPVAEKFCGDE